MAGNFTKMTYPKTMETRLFPAGARRMRN